MSAEADQVCGADYGTRTPERTNSRNGYRARDWDTGTGTGTVELAIPKLRHGSYFPEWLLQHRRRAEQALVTVVATSYLLGVSTRRVEKLAEQLGVKSLSKSQVSDMAGHLDAQVKAFRERPLDAGPYTFVAMDALTIKVRENGRIVNVHALIATGVNNDGHREILGLEVTSAEDGAGRLAGVPARPARPRAGRSRAGHQRRVHWSDGRCRFRVAGRSLATLPHPLPAQPAHQGAEIGTAGRRDPAPHDLRPGRRRDRDRAVRQGRSVIG